MPLTVDQILKMAPDAASAAAGTKLAGPRDWSELGQSSDAMWGKCQGSAVYQVKVDLGNMGYHCSCPSRKFPCKHVLGLLLLSVNAPAAVPGGASPEWVLEWLSKRKVREEKKAERAAEPPKPVDEKARAKRAAQREGLVEDGISRLNLWLADLVRTGLAGVERQPAMFWNDQAKRLVDAQAPGLAVRVKALAEIPASGADWPERLLGELGRLKLLLHAHARRDALEPALASEIRQLIGWTVSQQELDETGETVSDVWAVIGQTTEDEDRLVVQRSWISGRQSGRLGMLLQFSAAGAAFAESILPGVEQEAEVVFYPGSSRLRARVAKRAGAVRPLEARLAGHATLPTFLDAAADVLARSPWQRLTAGVLQDVNLAPADGGWIVRDQEGNALDLAGKDHWGLMATTGGEAFDLSAEWDGRRLRALGAWLGGEFRPL